MEELEKKTRILLAVFGVLNVIEYLTALSHVRMTLLDNVLLLLNIGWAIALFLPQRDKIMTALTAVGTIRALLVLRLGMVVRISPLYNLPYVLTPLVLLLFLMAITRPGLESWLPKVETLWFLPFAFSLIGVIFENLPLLLRAGIRPAFLLWILVDIAYAGAVFFICAWMRERARQQLRTGNGGEAD